MSAEPATPAVGTDLLTVDELSAAVGLTVRTTRYYTGLGLLPPPVRRGRVAYYTDLHRARLELVRALQDHGFTLQAIERFLASVPADAGVEDLALQRAMLTSWVPGPTPTLSRAELDEEAGRALTDDEVDVLVAIGALDRVGERYSSVPTLSVGLELLEVDIPVESMERAGAVIRSHMDTLVTELTGILRSEVLEPFRSGSHSPEEAAAMDRTVAQLRRLTLEAVVAGFQRAANDVVTRSLSD